MPSAFWQAKHPLADNIGLHLARPTADGCRECVQVRALPLATGHRIPIAYPQRAIGSLQGDGKLAQPSAQLRAPQFSGQRNRSWPL